VTLVSRSYSLAWDLRSALWGRKEVVVLLRERSLILRVRGYVVSVDATDAGAEIDDARWDEPIRVALADVRSVRRPHYHEDGPEPERNRPIFEPRRPAEEMPGQLRLGGDPPPVSARTRVAMERAAGLLLSQPLLDVLAALDRAARGRQSVTSLEVADAAGASLQWTVRRLAELAGYRLALAVAERPYRWTPGE
jgi:hypothetical protein